jgi:O-succinylbenzoate synthase
MRVELYRDDVVLARDVVASAQAHDGRTRLFLVLEHEGVTGYGEISPQPVALNGDPGLDEVLVDLAVVLARLGDVLTREGELPIWSRTARLGATTPSALFALALVEMAVLDRELRVGGLAVADLWPARQATRVQATVSSLDDATPWYVNEAVARVRVKSAPGALSKVARTRLASLTVPVILDFNCSATGDDEVLEQVRDVEKLAEISAVEQPYDAGNLVDHARLAARLNVPLSLDEGVRGVADLTRVANYQAASMVCVKPARVGGVANARAMLERAERLGLEAYVGGFFESPFARRVHRALADSARVGPSDLDVVDLRDTPEETSVLAGGFGLRPAPATFERARRVTVAEGASP